MTQFPTPNILPHSPWAPLVEALPPYMLQDGGIHQIPLERLNTAAAEIGLPPIEERDLADVRQQLGQIIDCRVERNWVNQISEAAIGKNLLFLYSTLFGDFGLTPSLTETPATKKSKTVFIRELINHVNKGNLVAVQILLRMKDASQLNPQQSTDFLRALSNLKKQAIENDFEGAWAIYNFYIIDDRFIDDFFSKMRDKISIVASSNNDFFHFMVMELLKNDSLHIFPFLSDVARAGSEEATNSLFEMAKITLEDESDLDTESKEIIENAIFDLAVENDDFLQRVLNDPDLRHIAIKLNLFEDDIQDEIAENEETITRYRELFKNAKIGTTIISEKYNLTDFLSSLEKLFSDLNLSPYLNNLFLLDVTRQHMALFEKTVYSENGLEIYEKYGIHPGLLIFFHIMLTEELSPNKMTTQKNQNDVSELRSTFFRALIEDHQGNPCEFLETNLKRYRDAVLLSGLQEFDPDSYDKLSSQYKSLVKSLNALLQEEYNGTLSNDVDL